MQGPLPGRWAVGHRNGSATFGPPYCRNVVCKWRFTMRWMTGAWPGALVLDEHSSRKHLCSHPTAFVENFRTSLNKCQALVAAGLRRLARVPNLLRNYCANGPRQQGHSASNAVTVASLTWGKRPPEATWHNRYGHPAKRISHFSAKAQRTCKAAGCAHVITSALSASCTPNHRKSFQSLVS